MPAHIAHPPLQGSARLWGTIALSAATFMNVLDSSIANVSLPAIAGDLGVSPNQGTWVITSFGVANAIALPLTGWLSQRFGQVRLFVASVLLFVISSWLCGLAPSMTVAYSLFMGYLLPPPLWLQQFMGYTSTQAGELMAPVGLLAIILSPLVGKNIQKFDPRSLTTFAFLVFALVLYMRSQFNTQADFATLMLPTIIQGAAVAFFFIPLTTIILNGIPPEKIAAASGLSSFARIVGGSFGTSIHHRLARPRRPAPRATV